MGALTPSYPYRNLTTYLVGSEKKDGMLEWELEKVRDFVPIYKCLSLQIIVFKTPPVVNPFSDDQPHVHMY